MQPQVLLYLCGELQELSMCVCVWVCMCVIHSIRSALSLKVTLYIVLLLCNHVARVFVFCKTIQSGDSQASPVMIIVCLCVCVGGAGDWQFVSLFRSTNVYATVMW